MTPRNLSRNLVYFAETNLVSVCMYVFSVYQEKFLDWEGLKGRGLTGDFAGKT